MISMMATAPSYCIQLSCNCETIQRGSSFAKETYVIGDQWAQLTNDVYDDKGNYPRNIKCS